MPRSERAERSRFGGPARVLPFMPGCDGAGLAVAAEDSRAGTGIARAGDLLANFGDRRTIAEGGSVFRAKDSSAHLYLIERGSLDIFLESSADGCPIASFGPGASFLYKPAGSGVAHCKAATASVAIATSLDRLDRLAREGLELRLLMYWYQSFDLQAFIATCYPDWDFGCASPK